MLGGGSQTIYFNPYNSVGRTDSTSIGFYFDNGTPIYNTVNITIALQTTLVNRFTSGVTGCVGPCSSTIYYNITLVVNPHPPIANLDTAGNCSAVSGWGFDYDAPGTELVFHVYLDGPAGGGGTLVGGVGSNVYRGDVNSYFGGYGLYGNHGFSFTMPDAYKYDNHTVYVYALGVNGSGAMDGLNTLASGSGNWYIGCQRVGDGAVTQNDCSYIGGWFVDGDAGDPFQINVYFGGGTVVVGWTSGNWWSVPVPAQEKSFSGTLVSVWGLGKNKSWQGDQWTQLQGSPFYNGPCLNHAYGAITQNDCSAVGGWFYDADYYASYVVNTYYTSGAVVTAYTSGYWWSSPVPAQDKHSYGTAVSVWALGLNASGGGDEWVQLSGSPFVNGPCKSSSCAWIQGQTNGGAFSGNIGYDGVYTVTKGQSFNMRMYYANSAPGGGAVWTTGQAAGQVDVGTDGPYSPRNDFGGAIRLPPANGSTSVAPGYNAYYDWSRNTGADAPGTYTINFQMLQELVEWYQPNAYGSASCQFKIQIKLPDPQITCVLNPPGVVETGSTYTPTAQIGHSGPAYAPSVAVAVYFYVDGALIGAYGNTLTNGPPTPSATATSSGAYSNPSPGNHTVYAYAATAYQSVVGCGTLTLKIANFPYFKTYGEDVITGSGFNTTSATPTCPTTSGNIYAYAQKDTPGATPSTNYKGTGAQYGAMARGSISGFFTSGNRNVANTPSKGLTLSNTTPVTTDEYGGNYGAGLPCIVDYFSDPALNPPNGGTRDKALTSINGRERVWTGAIIAGLGKYRYLAAGDTTIAGLTVPVGQQAAVYIDGDLTISNNITFASGAGTQNDMPNLAIIVRGNIFITPNVSRIDGLYVAQPRVGQEATKGRIYTCALAFAQVPAVNLASTCGTTSSQLAINGAVVAQQIKFLRTMNSLKDSTYSNVAPAGETPNFADGSGSGGGANTKAAEIINYTAEMYLAPSAIKDPDLSCIDANCKYDSIYSLPPVY
jgi:hypothetical protein